LPALFQTLAVARQITIRPWSESDSVPELTALLHRAYSVWAEKGIRFLATHQDDATTAFRLSDSFSFVATIEGRIVGTVSLYDKPRPKPCEYYLRPGVWSFGQFGVVPEEKGSGVGAQLLQHIEAFAREHGALELACDTAEPAVELHDYYQRNGYLPVDIHGTHHWSATNYRSLVLSKKL